MTALSVLDLVPVRSDQTTGDAIAASRSLAQVADELGYRRYWVAEHHNMPAVAATNPPVLIAMLASATERIRVGSGGVMLPNHAPLVVAEQFALLEALYPNRIDLGIGRAPGTDPTTSRALRPFDPARFSEQLEEMVGLSRGTLPEDHPFHTVRVIPLEAKLPTIWILGSSGASARYAGEMGMGYSFARHFSPTPPGPAFSAERESFRPSAEFPKPHIILGVAAVCAESDERAEYLAASMDLMWVRVRRGEFHPIPTPEEALAFPYTPQDRAAAATYRALVFVGDPAKVRREIEQVVEETGADEVMITSTIHSHAERVRSYELLAREFGLGGEGG